MASRETLERLRDVLARELETISLYERYAEAEADPEAKELLQHLADEEKEHVTELYEAILARDPKQKQWDESGAHAQALREGRFDGTAAPAGAAPPAAAPAPKAVAPRPRGQLTVGSLIGL